MKKENLLRVSCKRRKKELRFLKIVAFLAAFFLGVVLLYQDVSKIYMLESAKSLYGDWAIAYHDHGGNMPFQQIVEHPYLDSDYGVLSLGKGQLMTPEGTVIGSLGSMDDRLIDQGNILFYDGRAPEKEGEIMVETSVLATLGLDYELGQTLQMQYEFWNGEEMEKVDLVYEVVGIIRSYSISWVTGGAPALVVKEDLEKLEQEQEIFAYFSIQEDYKDIDVMEFCTAFDEQWRNSDFMPVQGSLEINTFVYDQTLWGSEVNLNYLVAALALIGITVLTYMCLSYLSKRRPYYYRYRSMGMSKMRLRQVIVGEILGATIPYTIGGIVVSYGAMIIICGWMAKYARIPHFFELRFRILGLVIASTLGTLLLSALMAILVSMGGSLRKGSAVLSDRNMKQFRKLGFSSRKKVEIHLLKRENKQQSVRKWILRLSSLLVGFVVAFCIVRWWESFDGYQSTCRTFNDFDVFMKEHREYTLECSKEGVPGISTMTRRNEKPVIGLGFSDRFWDFLEQIPYKDTVTYWTEDDTILLDWEDRIESEVIQAKYHEPSGDGVLTMEDFLPPIETNHEHYGYGSCYYPNIQEKVKELEPYFEDSVLDMEKLVSGEQVIVVTTDYEIYHFDDPNAFLSTEQIDVYRDHSLNAGEKITIQLENGKEIETEVAAVVRLEDMVNKFAGIMGLTGPNFQIIGSEELAKEIADLQGKPYLYNMVTVNFSPFSNYEQSAKELAGLAVAHQAEYTSQYDRRVAARDTFIKESAIYLAMIVLVSAAYLLIRTNLLQAVSVYRRKQITILRRCGMEQAKVRWMYRRNALWETAWIWMGIPFGYALRYHEHIQKLKGQVKALVTEFGEIPQGFAIEIDGTMVELQRISENFSNSAWLYLKGDFISVTACVVVLGIVFAVAILLQNRMLEREKGVE